SIPFAPAPPLARGGRDPARRAALLPAAAELGRDAPRAGRTASAGARAPDREAIARTAPPALDEPGRARARGAPPGVRPPGREALHRQGDRAMAAPSSNYDRTAWTMTALSSSDSWDGRRARFGASSSAVRSAARRSRSRRPSTRAGSRSRPPTT